MATLLEIYNLALGNLGIQRAILLTTEDTNEAIACNRFYDQALESALTDFPWPFATKWAALTLINNTSVAPPVPLTPLADWEYAYTYPADCLQLRSLVPKTGSARPPSGWSHQIRVPYAVGQYTPVVPTGFVLSGRYSLDPGTAPPGNLFAVITETVSGQVITAPGTQVLNTFIAFTFPIPIAAGANINVTFVVTPGAAFTAFPITTNYPATMPAANTTRDFSLQR